MRSDATKPPVASYMLLIRSTGNLQASTPSVRIPTRGHPSLNHLTTPQKLPAPHVQPCPLPLLVLCLRLRAGNMGVAPAVGVPVSSAIPSRTGGNMDQKRLTTGSTLYLPVEVGGMALTVAAGQCWCMWGAFCSTRLPGPAAQQGRIPAALCASTLASTLCPPLPGPPTKQSCTTAAIPEGLWRAAVAGGWARSHG